MPTRTPSPRTLARLDRAMSRAGYERVVEPPPLSSELVDMSAIAERAGTTLGTVKSWRNRHEDFPAPIVALAIGPVFGWTDVSRWLEGRRKPGAHSAE